MTKLDELTFALREGRMTRREFLAAAAAARATAVGTSLLPTSVLAAAPKREGRLRIGSAHGSTTDSLDPASYTDDGLAAGSAARIVQ